MSVVVFGLDFVMKKLFNFKNVEFELNVDVKSARARQNASTQCANNTQLCTHTHGLLLLS